MAIKAASIKIAPRLSRPAMTAISQGWDVDSVYAFETFAKVNAPSEPIDLFATMMPIVALWFTSLAYVVLIMFLVSIQLSEIRTERIPSNLRRGLTRRLEIKLSWIEKE
ncbi:uncharacterized protein TrAtP1_007050 [Trichoderma atroviride]|uniref:uncharacterized protein n=1 Tax=Hypocrea atroviridis TaxID=63577 RepID=UPI003328E9E8|nr:hypothetical protein TrAtP1_007050 [Trichoderma atroviride]